MSRIKEGHDPWQEGSRSVQNKFLELYNKGDAVYRINLLGHNCKSSESQHSITLKIGQSRFKPPTTDAVYRITTNYITEH